MNIRNILITLGVAAVAVPLLKSLYDWAQTPGPQQSANGTSPQVKNMVEKTFTDHQCEGTPFVHAFEEALNEEMYHDQELAQVAGLRA